MPPSPLRVHSALLTVSLLFGGNYVFTKRILAAVPPSAWALFRITAATIVLVPLALRFSRGRPGARLVAGLVLASFLGVALNQVLFTEGLARTTPEHSAVINACIPTWTLLAAVLVGQERLTRGKVVSIALALAGVQLLLGLDRLIASGTPLDATAVTGDLLTLANGFAFAAHLVLMRRIGTQVDPWTSTAILFVAGTAMIGAWSVPTLAAESWDAVTAPPIVWFAVYVVVGATVLPYLLNTWALRHAPGSLVALYINVQPLVAAALGMAMGGPAPGPRFFAALAFVFAALWLQTRSR